MSRTKKDGTAEVNTPGAAPPKKPGRMGRPVTKPLSKLVSYNIPLTLIQQIDEAAEKLTTNNKSRLIELAVIDYLKKHEKKIKSPSP